MSSTKVSQDKITNIAVVFVFFCVMLALMVWWLYAATSGAPTASTGAAVGSGMAGITDTADTLSYGIGRSVAGFFQ